MKLTFDVKDEYISAYLEALEKLNITDPSDKQASRLASQTFKFAGKTVLANIEEKLEEVITVNN